MQRVFTAIRRVDDQFVSFLIDNVNTMIRTSIGLIYLVFGALKFFPNFSPAEQLAADTINLMTFGWIHGSTALISLAIFECTIGVGLILGFRLKWIVRIALFHMLCTFFPLILIPEVSFTNEPHSLSLVGQYIFKNLIIISALLLIYCTDRKKQESQTKSVF